MSVHTSLMNARTSSQACSDAATWPAGMQLDGLSYETLNPPLTAKERLQWLRSDADGYQPQPYERLATFAKEGVLPLRR